MSKYFSKYFGKYKFYSILGLCTALVMLSFKLLFGLPAYGQETVTVNVLMNANEANQWQPFVLEFEAENPGIDLNIIEGPNATNLIEDLYTSAFLLGDSPYDLVYMDTVWAPKFAAAGWLEPLDDRIPKAELNQFLQGDVEAGRYQNQLYRIPVRSDVGMLYYRTDLLAEGGYNPPETFEELQTIAANLQENSPADWGYLWQGKQYEGLSAMFVEVLKGYGGFWIDPETNTVGLDRANAIDAVKFLTATIDTGITPKGVTTYTENETLRFFINGESVFLRNWPYVWREANKDDSPIAGKIALKPMVHAPKYNSGGCQGGWGLGISSTTAYPEEAWKVIQYFSSEKFQRQFVLSTSYVPSRRSLFTDPQIVAEYGHYPELLSVLDNAVLRPPVAQYAQASDILQRYLTAALSGRLTPEDAMQSAAAETRRLLGE